MRADTKEIIGTVDPDLLPAIVCACNSHVASVAALKAAVQIGVIGIKYADSIEGARPITDENDLREISRIDPSLVVDFRAVLTQVNFVVPLSKDS